MKKTIGILAHVDAGKTTVSEQLLYAARAIRKAGRVDHQDSFMDSNALEKKRGITIFSNQAAFQYRGNTYYLVDTPGHADFSAEMERAITVMDYAILIVSAVEGVQGHTETVWQLLKQSGVPCLLFINKTDRAGADAGAVLQEMEQKLGGNFIRFTGRFVDGQMDAELCEELAECDESLLELYLDGTQESGDFSTQVRKALKERAFFPCWQGAALLEEGTEEFWKGIDSLTETDYQEKELLPFSGVASHIRRSGDGKRLAFIKVMQGCLRAKDTVMCPQENGAAAEQKIDELRIYSGERFETVAEAPAGTLCAAVGLQGVRPGDGIGERQFRSRFRSVPAMAAKVVFGKELSPQTVLGYFKILEDEDPMLGVTWDAHLQEIRVRIMGAVQLEILQELVRERFGAEVSFGECEILYQETVAAPVVGYGHYEPLRHYAEVHLRLEPGARGSGIKFDSELRTDELAQQVQNLIRTHVFEKEHKGILTGSKLTDVKITLVAGRTHLKHTEGGDLREATYRAVRQALEKAENVLLEPYYSFVIEAEQEAAGRIMSDITRLSGRFEPPEIAAGRVRVTGRGPVAGLMNYSREFAEFTRGKGTVSLLVDGYEPCHNTEEVVRRVGYAKDRDMENPSSSVFCAKGAGFPVHWSEVEDYIDIQ